MRVTYSLAHIILLFRVSQFALRWTVQHADGLEMEREQKMHLLEKEISKEKKRKGCTMLNTVYPAPRSWIASSMTLCSAVTLSMAASPKSAIPAS